MSTVWREQQWGLPTPRRGLRLARPPLARIRRSAWRVREPLVDVFVEDDRVTLVVDLGGFRRHEVSVDLASRRIEAVRVEQRWTATLDLPPHFDVARRIEHLVNGVLVIVASRPTRATAPSLSCGRSS